MKGSVTRYCVCTDPATGKQLGKQCPKLANPKHGPWQYRDRIETSDGVKPIRRRGFRTKTDGENFQADVYRLLDLARGDDGTLRRIGDVIFERTKRSGQLPDAAEVRRRLGAGMEVDAASATVDEFGPAWLAGKRALKASVTRSYQQHLDNYFVPLLGEIPLDRLRAEHIAGMFDTIEEWNAEIAAAHEEGRAPHLPDDTRKRPKVVGIATQHRIFATLRNMLNAAVKRRRIDWNPCMGVELPPETRDPARVWSPEQVAAFLDAAESDRLGLLYRIVLLHGPRRGEAGAPRWEDVDLDTGHLTIAQTVLQLGGKVVIDTPKSRAGARILSLDRETVALLRAHRTAQRRERMAAGGAYQGHGLIFAREDGTPFPPDYISRRFREIAATAGLPVIKLHEARHTAATLGYEAGLNTKAVSVRMGHSTTRITDDLYVKVRPVVLDDAAERIAGLIPGRKSDVETGS